MKLLLVFIFGVCWTICAGYVAVHNECGRSNSYRVVGGVAASECEFPWMVMLYNKKESSVCGGSIIDEYNILTASHCFFAEDERTGQWIKTLPSDVEVHSGSSSMNSQRAHIVTQVITHEKYNPRTLENDIAILRLSRPLRYDNCHRPICLVNKNMDIYKASGCRVMGWGLTSNAPNAQVSEDLRWTGVEVSRDSSCRNTYGYLSSDKTFCAGDKGKDSCQGDSGGPFTCREDDGKFYIYGIVSAGLEAKCGSVVGIYTKVSSYVDWVHSKV